MNYRERNARAGLAGVVFLSVIGAIIAAVAMAAPMIIAVVGLLGRLQSALIERALAGLAGVSGWQFDSGSVAVRLLAAATIYAVVAFSLYFLFLVGSNLVTVIILAGGSALLGVLLTLASALQTSAPADHLSSLNFWD